MREWQEVWNFSRLDNDYEIKPKDRIILSFTNEWNRTYTLQVTVATAVNWGNDEPNWYVEGHLLHNGEPSYWKQKVDKNAVLMAVERLQCPACVGDIICGYHTRNKED